MPFSTIRPGTRERRGCGRIRRTTPNRCVSTTCTFATRLAPKMGYARRISNLFGFPFTAPTPASFTGHHLVAGYELQAGQNSAVQRQRGTTNAGPDRVDGGLCGFAQLLIFWIPGTISTWDRPAPAAVVTGYTLGCGPERSCVRCAVSATFPYSTIQNIFDTGRAHYNSLQIKAETKSARYGIYGLIGYTYSRSYDTGFTDGLGSIIGATYFPLPGLAKPGLGTFADQPEPEFHCQHYLRLAIWQRPEIWQQLERGRQRARRRLGGNRD